MASAEPHSLHSYPPPHTSSEMDSLDPASSSSTEGAASVPLPSSASQSLSLYAADDNQSDSSDAADHSSAKSVQFKKKKSKDLLSMMGFRRHHGAKATPPTSSSYTPREIDSNDDDADMDAAKSGRRSMESAHSFNLSSLHHPPPFNQRYVKVKSKSKTTKYLSKLILAQTLTTDVQKSPDAHDTDTELHPNRPHQAVWAVKFSKDGRYLAAAGQNCVVRVWQVLADAGHADTVRIFDDKPIQEYKGHAADILDLSWSKNNFLLSSSMDKTVRLWHVSKAECLCVFVHLDFVTSVKFHPKDDRFFLSGSLDGKVRLWSIMDKKVAYWNEVPNENMITAIGFTLDGRTACVGSYSGQVYFYETQGLKYNTQINVKKRGAKKGKKITGIEPMPNMPPGEEKLLISSNDSRIRMINMKDKSLIYKYKGLMNTTMQIKASFSDDGKYIISGSEDCNAYVWPTGQTSFSPYRYARDTHHLHPHHHHHDQAFSDDNATGAVSSSHHHHYTHGSSGSGTAATHTTINHANGSSSLGSGTTGAGNPGGSGSGTPSGSGGGGGGDLGGGDDRSGLASWLKRSEQRVKEKLLHPHEQFEAHKSIVTNAVFAPLRTRQLVAATGRDMIYNHTDLPRTSISSSDLASTPTTQSRSSLTPSSDTIIVDLLRDQLDRAKYDYPDGQILVTTDVHGGIQVWRQDCGIYPSNPSPATLRLPLINRSNHQQHQHGQQGPNHSTIASSLTSHSSSTTPTPHHAKRHSIDAPSTSQRVAMSSLDPADASSSFAPPMPKSSSSTQLASSTTSSSSRPSSQKRAFHLFSSSSRS
ncbi:WD40-repeat-containing domain protein [Gongronella butleri]|nr:WD40-repeat-containing domain protein [Gongronella butleri]